MQAPLAALQHLAGDGVLHPEEVARMVIPTVGRTEYEFSRRSRRRDASGVVREHLGTVRRRRPVLVSLLIDGDGGKLGAAWAGFARERRSSRDAGRRAGRRGHRSARAAFADALESAVAAGWPGSPSR